MNSKKNRISVIIITWLTVIVVGAGLLSIALTYLMFARRSQDQTVEMVRQNVEDVSTDIEEQVDSAILQYIDYFIEDGSIVTADMEELEKAGVPEELALFDGASGVQINIIDKDGIIVCSSEENLVGFDTHKGGQYDYYTDLLEGRTGSRIEEMSPTYGEYSFAKYGIAKFDDGTGYIEAGLSKDLYYESIRSLGKYATTNRRIGKNGYLLIAGEDMTIINSYHNEYTDRSLKDSGIDIDVDKDYEYESFTAEVFGVKSYVDINEIKGIYVVGVYSLSEAVTNVKIMTKTLVVMELVIFAVLFVEMIVLLSRFIIKNMKKVNTSLEMITDGNLEEKVDVRGTYEFDTLSDDINQMVDRLKGYIKEAEERLDADLEIARDIQVSVLPNVFPPFPDFKEFELFASMETAKEVGGDFYDFYMIGMDALGFLIADVSGKSIPGAMFMMRGKAIIKSLAESGLPPSEVFNIANEKLCEGNDAELFITAWMGYMDLNTGMVYVANAGHNPPVHIHNGKAEFLKFQSGFVLGGLEGMIYNEQTVRLEKGDILYLYTDGVTEAMDPDDEQFGDDRLLQLLSFGDSYPEPAGENGIAGAVCELVKREVNTFVKGAEQSDDITMLCVRYVGRDKEKGDD